MPGQRQLARVAAGLLGGLAAGRRGDGLAELDLAAGQQPPHRVRAAFLPDERHRAARPGTTTAPP